MLYSIVTLNAYQYELAVCTMFQNEGPYLKEWIEFNILTGVEHFYLYNNKSTDNYAEVLKPYIDAGIIDCIDWPYSHAGGAHHQILAEEHCGNSIQGRVNGRAQVLAYNHCLDNVRGKVKWLMCIDTDEFLFPTKCDDLRKFLQKYEEFSVVYVNWALFGTSNIKKLSKNKLLIESLTRRASAEHPRHKKVKSIVRPEKIEWMAIHRPVKFFPGCDQIAQDKNSFENREVRINHYWTRDEEYLYRTKIDRKYFFNTTHGQDWVLTEANKLNKEKDLVIQKYVERLRKKIFN